MIPGQGVSYFTNFLRQDNVFVDPILNNFSTNNPNWPYVYIGTAIGIRPKLIADTTFYLDFLNGNDLNTGLSATQKWKTWAHAAAVIFGGIDFGGHTVTLTMMNGSVAAGFGGQTFAITPWTGGGALILDGGLSGSPGVFDGDFNRITTAGGLAGAVTVRNMSLAVTASNPLVGSGILHFGSGPLVIGANMTFGACTLVHMSCLTGGAQIQFSANYTITGGALYHMLAQHAGSFRNNSSLATPFDGWTVTVTGTPVFSNGFAGAQLGGTMLMLGMTYTGAVGANSVPFFATEAGIIDTGNKGLNYFPGTVPGVVNPPGVYA